MKNLFILLFSLTFCAQGLANDLTARESELLVREIDNICGDTWCEGDFNFAFHTLECNFLEGECLFSIEVIDTLFDSDWNEVGEIRTPFICSISATSKESLFDENYQSYSDEFYESMTDCISSAEDEASSNRP